MLAMRAKQHWRTLQLATTRSQKIVTEPEIAVTVCAVLVMCGGDVDEGVALVGPCVITAAAVFGGYFPACLLTAPVCMKFLLACGGSLPVEEDMLHIIGTIIIGFVAGVIAKLVTPGEKEPQGFILTTLLGIVGAFAATYLGQAIGWYGPDENAGFIGAIVGAVLILLVWGFIDRRRRV